MTSFTNTKGQSVIPYTRQKYEKEEKKEMMGVPADTKIPSLLHNLLRFATPHKTKSEQYMYPLVCMITKAAGIKPIIDTVGNMIVRISTDDVPNPKTLFSSHLDTVHGTEGEIDIFLSTGPLEQEKDFLYASKKGKRCVLGADDKVGVYIMLKMIEAKVPGLYVFHVGEEAGCVGSKHIRKNNEKLLEGMSRAIAFDRKNYGDIVNCQGGKCCSDDFVDALALQLNKLKTDILGSKAVNAKYVWGGARGVYTDTAEYTDIIPECTNLSVGYFDQHTNRERTDFYWLETVLLPSILRVNWEVLPTKRDVTDTGYSFATNYGDSGHYGGYYSSYNAYSNPDNLLRWNPRVGLDDVNDLPKWRARAKVWLKEFDVTRQLEELEGAASAMNELSSELSTAEDLLAEVDMRLDDLYTFLEARVDSVTMEAIATMIGDIQSVVGWMDPHDKDDVVIETEDYDDDKCDHIFNTCTLEAKSKETGEQLELYTKTRLEDKVGIWKDVIEVVTDKMLKLDVGTKIYLMRGSVLDHIFTIEK